MNWLIFGACIAGMVVLFVLIILLLAILANKHEARQNRVRDEIAEIIYKQNIGVIPTDENTGPAPAQDDKNKDWFED